MESILVRQLVAPAAAAAVLSLACAPLARAQVSSVSPFTAVQFTDVMPTDWAYQALQNLLGCNLREKQLQQGDHLTKRCKLWDPTWQKEMGWAPEAG